MSRTVIQRLRDARDHARRAIDCTRAFDAGGSGERLALEAALFNIAVLGEAISFVPNEVRTLAPNISWAEARGMRNYVVHEYWRIDIEIVSDTICRDLPLLVEQLQALMNRLEACEAGLED